MRTVKMTDRTCPRCGAGPVLDVIKDEWVTVDHFKEDPTLGIYVVGIKSHECSDCDEGFYDCREERGVDYYLWQVWRVTGQRADLIEAHPEYRSMWEADLAQRGLTPDGIVVHAH